MIAKPNEFTTHLFSLPPAEQAAYASQRFATMSEKEQLDNMLYLVEHTIPGSGLEGNREMMQHLVDNPLRSFFKEYHEVVEKMATDSFEVLPEPQTDEEFIQAHLKVAEFEGPLLTPIQLMQLHPLTTPDLVTSIYRALRKSVDTVSLRQEQVANLTIHLVQSLAKELRP